jgi:hypothetical protein
MMLALVADVVWLLLFSLFMAAFRLVAERPADLELPRAWTVRR